MKRTLDLIVSTGALLILAPLLGLICLFIKWDSPGPIFYRGVRSGRWEKPFRMFKFRTMVPQKSDAVEGTTGLGDPRITRVGHTLRKYKLDELPQLLNVLTGEMSIVGPRPELPRYTRLYSKFEEDILSVRPGMTDLSSIEFVSLDQIVGSTDVDRNYEEKVLFRKNELRLKYAKENNLWLDGKIILKTFQVLLKKAGKNTLYSTR